MASPCCHCPPPHSPFLAICLLLHSHLILQEILLVHVPHGWMPTTSHPICHCHPGLRGHTPCNRPLIGSTPFRGFSSHLANNRSPFPAYTALRVLDLPTSPSPTPASLSSPRLPRPQRSPCCFSRPPNPGNVLSSLRGMLFPDAPSFLSGHCSNVTSLEKTSRITLAGMVSQHSLNYPYLASSPRGFSPCDIYIY